MPIARPQPRTARGLELDSNIAGASRYKMAHLLCRLRSSPATAKPKNPVCSVGARMRSDGIKNGTPSVTRV